MRSTLILAAAAILIAGTAQAAWKEFSYPDSRFAAPFPSEPKLEVKDYPSANGNGVKQKIYTSNSGGVLYIVSIADFSNARADKDRTIDEAANAIIKLGKMTHDESGRIDGNYGREIRVETPDGTSYTDAIFFVDKRLYQIEVIFPKVNTDPMGSAGIGFFQTAFRFVY